MLDSALAEASIEIVSVSVSQARLAAEAYARFGKGRGHPARLNYGDCFAYALAKERGEPLLFKGSDFARTDIAAAI
jgi:ribonuclease VapC